MYKKAIMLKVRFANPNHAVLTTEDISDFTLEQMNSIACGIRTELKELDGESFIKKPAAAPSLAERRLRVKFAIVKDLIETKQKAAETAEKAAITKQYNEKIAGLILKKKEEGLEALSIEDLEALQTAAAKDDEA
jgi:hypothetical protein